MIKLVYVFLICVATSATAQKAKKTSQSSLPAFPLNASAWSFQEGGVEFTSHRNQPAMKVLKGVATLKDFNFKDGTIEFDIEPVSPPFTGVYFRMTDQKNSEYFYLRVGRAGNLTAMDAAQYAPIDKGVNMWDMLDHFQGPANIKKADWNHVKLVVSGKQLLVYVNDSKPTLEVPRMEGNTTEGTLGFAGPCVISNLVVRHNQVEGLLAAEGIDPTSHDTRYIRTWLVSEPQPLPAGRELFSGDFPKPGAKWQPLEAERRGLINLTRIYGQSESRRAAWLTVKLKSTSEQRRKVSLGFSDEVWVFLNGQYIYSDKNIYMSPVRKEPDGRISIENGEFELPLKSGDNELLIGLANDFFGWGLIARLDNMEGIIVDNSPKPTITSAELDKYLGTYSSPDFGNKLFITKKENILVAQVANQEAVDLEFIERDKFRFALEGVMLEFDPEEKKMVLKQGSTMMVFARE
jgi:hypothetical protein